MFLFINFIKSWLMFGFCQNVEIIHEHHHHFYPSTPSLPNKTNTSLSRMTNPGFPHQEGTLSANRSQPLQESYTSKFYHSQRGYFHKSQRGIQVVCKNQGKQGGRSRNNSEMFKKLPIQYHLVKNLQPDQHLFDQNPNNTAYLPSYRPIEHLGSHTISYNKCYQQNLQYVKVGQGQKQAILQMSTPTINIHLASQNSSLTTKKHHAVHAHQLRQSTIGFPEANIYETRKIHHEILSSKNHKISLCIPIDHHSKLSPLRSAQTCREISYDKDSMLTKKQTHFIKAFKTQRLLDDAKSIVSHESADIECLNIEESMIISRSMDYFCHLTPQISFQQYRLYLAKDKYINWVVSIRVFENQNEQRSFHEANIYNKLAAITEQQQINFAILELYKVLIEGVPPHKNIIFVLQPYESLLQQLLIMNRQQFRLNPPNFFNFLRDLQEQLYCALMNFNRYGLILIQSIDIKDIVRINGKYKFHSVLKFGHKPQSAPQELISNLVITFIKSVQASVRYYS